MGVSKLNLENMNEDLVKRFNTLDLYTKSGLNTETTTALVDALNEIIGKNIISKSVGAPLENTDLWKDMGSKIDTLTNEFRSKLSEKGVEVSEDDKYNTLINKIDDINTGTVYYSNKINNSTLITGGVKTKTINIETNLGFIPSIIILNLGYISCSISTTFYSEGINVTTLSENGSRVVLDSVGHLYLSITNITENSFGLQVRWDYSSGTVNAGSITWYAFR